MGRNLLKNNPSKQRDTHDDNRSEDAPWRSYGLRVAALVAWSCEISQGRRRGSMHEALDMLRHVVFHRSSI